MGFPHKEVLASEEEDFTARKAGSLSDIVDVKETTNISLGDLNLDNTPDHECPRKEYFEWNCIPVDYQQSGYCVLLMSPHKVRNNTPM